MSELQDLSDHFHERLSSIQRLLDLSSAEVPQNKMKKLAQEITSLGSQTERLETFVERQRDQLKQLKALEEIYQHHLESVQHLVVHIPVHMPKRKSPAKATEAAAVKSEAAGAAPVPAETSRRGNRNIRTMMVITLPEFEGIPQYMKGRITYDQLNAAVQTINAAVVAKYKIVQQPVRSLNNHSKKLHQRFKELETGDTKGQFFVVEEDIRDFTQVKVDKRFQLLLNMLRHCHRLKELRGGGCTRYMLL
ncbi:SKA complex subunit 1 [Neosynchiropus ocellatus]